MGTIKQGILGGFSGTVGTVVGASWNGIDYMRAKATSVTQPNSPAQLDQRAKFKAVIDFLKPLISILRIGYKKQAVKMTAFNAAMRYTLNNAVSGIYPAYEVDYANAMLSQGTLPQALNPAADSALAGRVEFTWQDNSLEAGAKPDDKAMLVVYSPAKKKSVNVVGGNTRSSAGQIINLPADFSGDEVQCYIGFSNANGSEISNSQFVAAVVIL